MFSGHSYVSSTGDIRTESSFSPNQDQDGFKDPFKQLKSTFYQLIPSYLDKFQPNLDPRTKDDQPYEVFDPDRYKTGIDLFTPLFFTLFAILVYTLLFYNSVVGISGEINLNHFTVG